MRLLLLLSVACTPDVKAPATDGSDDTSAPIDDTGTGDSPAAATNITAEISEYVQTVVIVRWTTEVETTGHVVFGETDAYGFQTPDTAPGTSHEVLLLGLPGDTEAHFKVYSSDGAAMTLSADHTITTGTVPNGLPTLTLTGDHTVFDGWYVTSVQGTENAMLILDNQGRIVWYAFTEDSKPMRVQLDKDGGGLSSFATPIDGAEVGGNLLRVSMDGSERTYETLGGLDHDFLEREAGIFGVMTSERDPTEATASVATGVREQTQDGTSTQIWSAWDDLDPADYPDADFSDGNNWTHGNAIEYVAEHDEYLVSLADLPELVSVDRVTGDLNWKLFGEYSEFTLAEGSETVPRMHQMDRWGDNLLVFDNGSSDRQYSRAVEFELDLDTMTATQVWEYIHDPPLYVYVLGDVERLDDGNTVVTWSTAGEIEVVSPEGEVLSRIASDLGAAFTYNVVTRSLYGE